MNSPFDRFRAGDASALTEQQQRGMETFDEVGCDRCHEGPMFSDFDLHAEGVGENPKLLEPDAGTRRFRFRTPSLRNVALTAPYMHNGMLDDARRRASLLRQRPLRESQRRDDSGDRTTTRTTTTAGRGCHGRFRRVDDMSDREMRDIIAFLESLTDREFDRAIPGRVPSGLPPGGAYSARPVTERSASLKRASTSAAANRSVEQLDRVHTGLLNPRRSHAAVICNVHPGLPVAMTSGCSAMMWRAFRSPSAAAGSGCTRL